MIKRIGLVIAVFVISLVIACVVVVKIPSVTQAVLKFLIQKNLTGYKVNDLRIGDQQWIFPGDVSFSDVVFKLSTVDQSWSIKAGKVKCQNIQKILFSKAKIDFQVRELDLSGKDIVVNMANLSGFVNFIGRSLSAWQAQLEIKSLQAMKYQMTNISSQLSGDKTNIHLDNIQASLYGGGLTGKVDLQLFKPVWYQTSLTLKQINLQLFKGVNDSIYQNIQGILNADVMFQGQGNHLQTIAMKANIVKDAQIRASILKFFIPYIPPTKDVEVLRELIRKDLKIPVEKADVNLQRVDHQKLSGEIHLGIRKVNLDLNLPIDILFDGNLMVLMQWYQKMIQ